MSNGIILFGTTGMLVKAEKLLISEGCTITRSLVPFDQHSGCAIGLRFPWSNTKPLSQYSTKQVCRLKGYGSYQIDCRKWSSHDFHTLSWLVRCPSVNDKRWKVT